MAAPQLSRDIAYLDLVSDLKGEVEGFADHARALLEATGAGTLADAERALQVLAEQTEEAYEWDRPLTRQDRLNRKAIYEAKIQAGEATLAKVPFGTTEAEGADWGRGMSLVGLFASVPISVIGSLHWHAGLGGLLGGILVMGISSVVACTFWGMRRGRRNHERYAPLRAEVHSARQRLRDEAPVELDPDDARTWLAFPEVAAQARRWAKSSPGLMAEDVRLLDKRCRELDHAQDQHQKASVIDRLLG